jgi:Na+/proline symporter
MTKGNLLDITVSTVFVAFWTLLLRGGETPIKNLIILWILFLILDTFVALTAKRTMKSREKYKSTKQDVGRFLISMSYILIMMGGVLFLKWSSSYGLKMFLAVLILYAVFLLLASTMARAGVKIDTAKLSFWRSTLHPK